MPTIAQQNFIPCQDHQQEAFNREQSVTEMLREYAAETEKRYIPKELRILQKELWGFYHTLLLQCKSCRKYTKQNIRSLAEKITRKPARVQYPDQWWYHSSRMSYYLCDDILHSTDVNPTLRKCCWIKKLEGWCEDMNMPLPKLN